MADRAKCNHRHRDKLDGQPGWMLCSDCGNPFKPKPRKRVYHGTYRGWSKHRRTKAGNWPWPVGEDCGCAEAGREYHREYAQRPGATAARRAQNAARRAAALRLQKMYPTDYRQLYAAEVATREGTVTRAAQPPAWDAALNQLLKVLGVDHNDLSRSVAGGWATSREREIFRLARQLRA